MPAVAACTAPGMEGEGRGEAAAETGETGTEETGTGETGTGTGGELIVRPLPCYCAVSLS